MHIWVIVLENLECHKLNFDIPLTMYSDLKSGTSRVSFYLVTKITIYVILYNYNPLGVINENILLMDFLLEIYIQLEQKCQSELVEDTMTQPQSTPNETLPRKKEGNGCAYLLMALFIAFFIIVSKNTNSVGSYVAPHHTRSGKMVKGHARKSTSTDAHAVQHRNRTKGYHYLHKSRYSKK